jgi:hypothetical protein
MVIFYSDPNLVSEEYMNMVGQNILFLTKSDLYLICVHRSFIRFDVLI